MEPKAKLFIMKNWTRKVLSVFLFCLFQPFKHVAFCQVANFLLDFSHLAFFLLAFSHVAFLVLAFFYSHSLHTLTHI